MLYSILFWISERQRRRPQLSQHPQSSQQCECAVLCTPCECAVLCTPLLALVHESLSLTSFSVCVCAECLKAFVQAFVPALKYTHTHRHCLVMGSRTSCRSALVSVMMSKRNTLLHTYHTFRFLGPKAAAYSGAYGVTEIFAEGLGRHDKYCLGTKQDEDPSRRHCHLSSSP